MYPLAKMVIFTFILVYLIMFCIFNRGTGFITLPDRVNSV
jgi:hypothetical protein